ncbi:MAG: AraC family transcriptional regulator N-terminal domain-containing protein [Candidatus Sericytochromatia bacterium]
MTDTIQDQSRLLHETAARRREMSEKLARWLRTNNKSSTPIPWLALYSRTEATHPQKNVYEPVVVIVLQGCKQVNVGEESFIYDESRFLMATIDMPVCSHIMEASPEKPYQAMIARLDLGKVRQLILDFEIPAPKITSLPRCIATGPATPELLGAFGRLLDLLETPRDVPVLSALIYQEILYYLLRSEQGGRLWQMAMSGSQSNRIQKIVNWLLRHYAEPLRMEALAEMAAMSVSSMHHYFREITSMSPLQFQKQLRLQEARRLMLIEDLDAGLAAIRVGYESASQFSREYARYFGQPPLRDIKQLRAQGAEEGLSAARTA